jgi:hypothetical protein
MPRITSNGARAMEWYMEQDGGQAGPFSDEVIREMAAQGRLAPATRVWRAGMDHWKRASEVPGLLLPPALPGEHAATSSAIAAAIAVPVTGSAATSSDAAQAYRVSVLARAWPRYWARLFDLMFGAIVGGVMLGLLAPEFLAGFEGPGGEMWLNVLFVPIALLIDAAVGALFGVTPGKWALGLRVRTVRNEKPAFGTLLGRNARLYMSGLAFALPLISLFTLVRSFQIVKRQEFVSWDIHSDTRVYDVANSLARTWVAAGAVFATYMVISMLAAL